MMQTGDSGTKPRLRVGLLVNSLAQPRWVKKIIEDINASSVAEIVLVIKNETTEPPKPSRIRQYWGNRDRLLYILYSKLDEAKSKVAFDGFETTDIAPLVEHCPVINVRPQMQKFTDRLQEEDVKKILEHRLDVALRFGFRILKGRVLEIARYGVWSYHHGDGLVNRGGPAGFWEVLEGNPITGVMLQILTEDLDNGKVLYRSWSPTIDKFSVRTNRNHYYWKSSALVMRKLKELYQSGSLSLDDGPPYSPYCNRLYKIPTNSEMGPLLARMAGRYVASKTEDLLYFRQWSLAYRFRSTPDDPNNAFFKFKFLVPPKDRFWADPFPVKVGDKYFVFIEEYTYAEGKGFISVVELGKKGMLKEPVKVLERDYHLSYPFIFEWQGDYYMIPETASNNAIELYRCASFPGRWELEKVLVENIKATDATIAEIDGMWWMFANVAEGDVPSDWNELYLYYAVSPFGPWTPHQRNPVKSDVRGSRPAGRLFHWQGKLYRPAQDSSHHYGYAISINRINRLSRCEFAEEEVSKILPRWKKNVVGIHTLNSDHDLTIIDCLMKRGKRYS